MATTSTVSQEKAARDAYIAELHIRSEGLVDRSHDLVVATRAAARRADAAAGLLRDLHPAGRP